MISILITIRLTNCFKNGRLTFGEFHFARHTIFNELSLN